MGLFDRFRKTENAVQINDVKQNITVGWNGLYNLNNKQWAFADFYLWLVFDVLYNGISNVTFKARKSGLVQNEIVSFLDRNSALLMNQMIYQGYIAVMYTKNDGIVTYHLPKTGEIKTDGLGRVVNPNTVVVYAPCYQMRRTNDVALIRPQLDLLNTLCNTMVASSDTMGVLPILWGNSIPADPKYKQELEDMMSRNYGWTKDKFRYFLSRQELHVETVDLKIKDLELSKNIEDTFGYLCRYFGVPTDLIYGNSTFSNVGEAKKFFYDTTIRRWAETLLKVGRYLLTETGDYTPQDTITYFIENVPEVERTLSSACSEKNAYIDSLLKLQSAGIDVTDELAKVYNDLKKTYIEV